jgi:hypothetical protein
MNLKDFFYADKHAAGTTMPIPLPSGADSGEWLRVVGPACDAGVKAARDYSRAYTAVKEELAPLEAKCAAKNDWTEYNTEMNWRADELNDILAPAVVVGWSLDDEFTPAAVAELIAQYKGLSTYVADHFHKSRKTLLEK